MAAGGADGRAGVSDVLGRPVDSWAMRLGEEDGARAGPARGGRPSRLLCSVWDEGTCGASRRVGPVAHLGLAGHVLGPDWLSYFLNKPRLLYCIHVSPTCTPPSGVH